MSDLVDRLRAHVNNRGGASLQNGAWQMMLDAADEIERQRNALLKIEQETIDHFAVGIARTALALPSEERS